MAQRYTSRMALVLDRPVDVRAVVEAAREHADIDRHEAVGDSSQAQQVFWGGRMNRAVVRPVDGHDGVPLLRTEAYIGGEGPQGGLSRQARLLLALARHLDDSRVAGVRDLSAAARRDVGWLERLARGEVALSDAIIVHREGRRTLWVHTHGAARFDVPDLELYGLSGTDVDGAVDALRHVHRQLLAGGLTTDLSLPDNTPVYLVPVMEAWRELPLDWPGIGRADRPRTAEAGAWPPGHRHGGPRATLSVLHKRRLGRYPRDFSGVVERLGS